MKKFVISFYPLLTIVMYLAPLNYDRFFKKVFADKTIAKAFLEDFLTVEIESLDILPKQQFLSDDAVYVEFDFRCQINGSYVIIDMQQWYKPDIVQRFYLYHALNTGLQLEQLPKERFDLTSKKQVKITKDYRELEPVITLIWMVDDTLGFSDNYVSYIMTPEVVVEFLKNGQLWQPPEIQALLEEKNRLLTLLSNETKDLDFLPKNRLIFAFQKNIVRNTHHEQYERWFTFAERTRNQENTEDDFHAFREHAIFAEIIRRLERKALTEDDLRYIEKERENWEQVARLERGFFKDGLRQGEKNEQRRMVMRLASQKKTIDDIIELTGYSQEFIQHILQAEERHHHE